MNTSLTGAARRLTFSLVAVSAFLTLGGCAVYGPTTYRAVGAPVTTTTTDANGQVTTTTVQTVTPTAIITPSLYVNPYPYYPYAYDPWFVGPPLYFNFGIRGGGGGRWHGGGGRRHR